MKTEKSTMIALRTRRAVPNGFPATGISADPRTGPNLPAGLPAADYGCIFVTKHHIIQSAPLILHTLQAVVKYVDNEKDLQAMGTFIKKANNFLKKPVGYVDMTQCTSTVSCLEQMVVALDWTYGNIVYGPYPNPNPNAVGDYCMRKTDIAEEIDREIMKGLPADNKKAINNAWKALEEENIIEIMKTFLILRDLSSKVTWNQDSANVVGAANVRKFVVAEARRKTRKQLRNRKLKK